MQLLLTFITERFRKSLVARSKTTVSEIRFADFRGENTYVTIHVNRNQNIIRNLVIGINIYLL